MNIKHWFVLPNTPWATNNKTLMSLKKYIESKNVKVL